MTDRIQREQAFHDQRFTKPAIRACKVGRFYRLATSVQADYCRLLAQESAVRVLEYGCGTANYALALAQNGSYVMGIDISRMALQVAQKATVAATNINFLQMNAEEMALAANSFDLVCGTGILHHLHLETALSEITRVLQPNGRAIFIEPLGHNIFINAFRRFTPTIRSEDERPLLSQDLYLFHRYFSHVETKYYYLTSLVLAPFTNLKLFPTLLKMMETADRTLFKLPFLQKQAWQILIQLSQPK